MLFTWPVLVCQACSYSAHFVADFPWCSFFLDHSPLTWSNCLRDKLVVYNSGCDNSKTEAPAYGGDFLIFTSPVMWILPRAYPPAKATFLTHSSTPTMVWVHSTGSPPQSRAWASWTWHTPSRDYVVDVRNHHPESRAPAFPRLVFGAHRQHGPRTSETSSEE